LTYFRGSELQNYFTKVLEDDLKTVIKPQYVDQIPKAVKGTVADMLKKKSELGNEGEMIQILGIYVIILVPINFSNHLIIN
jgi:ATP-binding cassette, sub-family E, member 1